jgi:hypothetical protein
LLGWCQRLPLRGSTCSRILFTSFWKIAAKLSEKIFDHDRNIRSEVKWETRYILKAVYFLKYQFPLRGKLAAALVSQKLFNTYYWHFKELFYTCKAMQWTRIIWIGAILFVLLSKTQVHFDAILASACIRVIFM